MYKFIIAILLSVSTSLSIDASWIETICLSEKAYITTIESIKADLKEMRTISFPPSKGELFEREIVENNIKLLEATLASARREYRLCKKYRKLSKQ